MDTAMHNFDEYAVLLHQDKLPKIFQQKGLNYHHKLEKTWPANYGISDPYQLRTWLVRALESPFLNPMLYSIYASSSSLELSHRKLLAEKLEALYNQTELFQDVYALETLFKTIAKAINDEMKSIAEYKYIDVFFEMLEEGENLRAYAAVDRLNIIISNTF